MIAYNSKVYYVITEGAGLGDNVRRVPITRQRDGAGRVEHGQRPVAGVEQEDLDRPSGAGAAWAASRSCRSITKGSRTGGWRPRTTRSCRATGCSFAEDNVSTFNNFLAKVTLPIERLLGTSGLGASTIRGFQTLGRNYNRQRSF